jgi:hypothetical protein
MPICNEIPGLHEPSGCPLMTMISFDMVECTSEAPQAYREQFRDPGRAAYRQAQSRIIKGNLQEPTADTLDIRGRSNYSSGIARP